MCARSEPPLAEGPNPNPASRAQDSSRLGTLVGLPIRAYQRWISPWLPPTCRFHPTCSAYGVEALRRHGPIRGTTLLAWRLLRCQPFARGGYDPVPPPRRERA